MSATDLHGDDDKLGEYSKLRRERGIRGGEPQRKPNRSVRRHDLEQTRKQGERVLVVVLQARPFHDGDDEEPEEDVPQIETELIPQMCTDVARLFAILLFLLR